MKERLIIFLAHLGIGQAKFEAIVGLSRGFVNKIGENITLNSLNKITEAYPELNINWLKTGEGEMLKSNHQYNKVKTNTGIVGIQGNNVTVNKSENDKLFELLKTKDEQLNKSQEQISKSQEQISEVLNVIKSKDEQINRLIGLVEKHGK